MKFQTNCVLVEADPSLYTKSLMVRTKQLPSLSTGGKVPRKKIATKAARISWKANVEAQSKLPPQTRLIFLRR